MSLVKFLLKSVDLKEEIYGYIYKITNQTNNKSYIGQTINENKCRWDGTLKGAKIYNKHLQNSMNKYGVECFKIEIIDTAKNEKELNEKEIHWIGFYNTINQNYGYNKTYGGEGGKPTKETRKKMSDATKGEKNHNYGKCFSEETKRKLSESHKREKHWNYGKHLSEETKKKLCDARLKRKQELGYLNSSEARKKMSESKKGINNPMYGKHHTREHKRKLSDAIKGENNYWYGKHHSEESKKKISDTLKGRHHSEESKKKMSESQQRRYLLEKKLKQIV